MPKPLREQSGTYVKPGVEREMLIRIRPASKADIDHVRDVVCQKLAKKPSLGVFIAFCASVGADLWAAKLGLGRVPKLHSLEVELERRGRLPLKQELMKAYDDFYRGLPQPGIGEFIVFLACEGSCMVRDTYGRK